MRNLLRIREAPKLKKREREEITEKERGKKKVPVAICLFITSSI